MKLLLYIVLHCINLHDAQPKLRVGGKYTICGPKEDNPFEKQARATVIITAMKRGYVQYCWAHDYKNTNRTLYSRSEKEFIDQIKYCN